MTPLIALLRKEVRHILRDRRTLAVLLALPVVQVLLFGFAIRTDVREVRLAIVDPAPDPATRALRARFASAGVFRQVAVVGAVRDLDPLFQDGTAQEAVVFEAGFAAALGRGEPVPLQVITDATEPNTGSLLQAYTLQVVRAWERERRGPRGADLPGVAIVPSVRMRFNPTRESSNLFVPGLLAFVMTIISSLMTAISLAREKETGTMEALLVSPLHPLAIVAGKVIPYLAIGAIGMIAVIVEARLVFHVPLQGSLGLLLAEGGLFILTSLSFGILISARTSSQRVAMMAALVGAMLPNILLSGFIFPVESMPLPLQLLSRVVAGRWFVTVARAIMLKGVGIEHVWRETLVLAVMAGVLLAAGTRSFKARLE